MAMHMVVAMEDGDGGWRWIFVAAVDIFGLADGNVCRPLHVHVVVVERVHVVSERHHREVVDA